MVQTQTNHVKKDVVAIDNEKAPIVHAAKDYGQFKRIIGNRSVQLSHVNELVKKISIHNLLSLFPVVVSKDGYLIDGQHRIAAAKANKLTYFYIQSKESLEDVIVAIINSSQRGWRIDDYINFFAERGNEQYIFIADLKKKYKISIANLCALFGYKYLGSKSIKNGTLKSYSTEEEKKVLLTLVEALFSLKEHFNQAVYNDREFVLAIRIIFEQLSAPEIIEGVKKASLEITVQTSSKDYLRLFESIFNRYRRENNQIRFF